MANACKDCKNNMKNFISLSHNTNWSFKHIKQKFESLNCNIQQLWFVDFILAHNSWSWLHYLPTKLYWSFAICTTQLPLLQYTVMCTIYFSALKPNHPMLIPPNLTSLNQATHNISRTRNMVSKMTMKCGLIWKPKLYCVFV